MMTTEHIVETKKRNIPPPGAYEPSKGEKAILGHSSKSEKTTYHVDEAVHYAKLTPTVCYKDIESLSTMIKPRCLYTKIPAVKETAQEANRIRPKKSHDPDMGTYRADKS